jgi:murein DD-endopeptidase MepM/ murein hydrolase activator NlpD
MKQLLTKLQQNCLLLRKRIFVYSDETSNFQEVKKVYVKLFGIVLSSLLLGALGTLFIVFIFSSSSLNSVLVQSDHTTLRSQLEHMENEIEKMKTELGHISLQGNKLRMLVDLPVVDKTVAKAGTGGTEEIAVPGLTSETNNTFDAAISKLASLQREINIQQQSFKQVQKKAEFNKKLFDCLPSLKPMEGYYSPTGFGNRMHPVLGLYKTHVGLDIIGNVGTPIYATGDGIVEFAGRNTGGYGLMIEINHGFGYKTLYAHCSKLFAKEGTRVKRGDIIAKSGKSGLVSGPHLHYEVSYNGVKQNPVDFFFDDIRPSSYKNRRYAQK